MKKDTHLRVSVDARLRDYRYTAWLTPTGQLSSIQAGCRAWCNFEEAQEHYAGRGPYNPGKWADEYILNEFHRDQWRAAKHYAHRMDARRVLVLLQKKVDALQERMANKRKKARKQRFRAVAVIPAKHANTVHTRNRKARKHK